METFRAWTKCCQIVGQLITPKTFCIIAWKNHARRPPSSVIDAANAVAQRRSK